MLRDLLIGILGSLIASLIIWLSKITITNTDSNKSSSQIQNSNSKSLDVKLIPLISYALLIILFDFYTIYLVVSEFDLFKNFLYLIIIGCFGAFFFDLRGLRELKQVWNKDSFHIERKLQAFYNDLLIVVLIILFLICCAFGGPVFRFIFYGENLDFHSLKFDFIGLIYYSFFCFKSIALSDEFD